MEQYELVPQEDEWGCGAACVASLLGISYANAKKRLEAIKRKPLDHKPKGLDIHEIWMCLALEGRQYVGEWKKLRKFAPGTIVCIRGSAPYDGDHYLLMTPKGWMDPYSNMERPKDLYRESTYRDELPPDTKFVVALVPR
ncbi:hypothetical protein [Stenotrophomonas maltophilia]|uniref:hypothetical protein n=1 Tax=Stenotrophomonas maltophilia TaxID=40324 RepID=UPI0012603B52|nr:hypothetical protein [Stenotrophomonas maltophilia]